MRKLLPIIIMTVLFISACAGGAEAPSDDAPARGSKVTTEDSETPVDHTINVAEADVSIANPWGETQSLTAATDSSDVSFTPPAEELFNGTEEAVSLKTYRYMQNTVEALYESGDNLLTIRKSVDTGGDSLTGDYNSYPEEWDENIDSITVHCKGSSDSVNAATYEIDGEYFSISFNPGNPEHGLSLEQLRELIGEIR